MPSTLLSLHIKGIRSYSPREDEIQTVDFMPLTLIVGKNGTGKTTLIESLKFIVSGEEPPHSDCRRNFINTRNEKLKPSYGQEPFASIEIRYQNSSKDNCIARREIFQSSCGKPPVLSSKYKIGNNIWITVHKQDDWNTLLPRLFGLPNQAILSNVILCHQEDNLWCMGDSANVKQVFDKIFGCEQYKKEIRHIDDEIRASKKDQQLCEKDLLHRGEKVERKKALAAEIEGLERELARIVSQSKDYDSDIALAEKKRKTIQSKIDELEIKSREIVSLKQRANELKERDVLLRRSLQPLLNRKRPPPPPPARKKPAPDPTVTDLSMVIENLEKLSLIADKLPTSPELAELKGLLADTLERIATIKSRFASPPQEEEVQIVPVEEPEEDPQDVEYRNTVEGEIRENMKQLESIKDSIEKIQQQISNDENLNHTKLELRAVEQELISLRDQRSTMIGSKMQIERELKRIKAEIVQHSLANTLYAESLGRSICNKIAISDLEKLKQCFQESITNFHDQMLIKINEALRARWRQVYQGSDIDYIELVDEEITRGKDKKSYNYYMAMWKGNTRMKMREKSSAGQRALASIILRMTLAELFVRDFAFIALDEPTANLDFSNVQALARAIGSYVRKRNKKGANIQWIIITHDEQFLRALDEECSPFFYRTEMDQNGYSKIRKISYQDWSAEIGDTV